MVNPFIVGTYRATRWPWRSGFPIDLVGPWPPIGVAVGLFGRFAYIAWCPEVHRGART